MTLTKYYGNNILSTCINNNDDGNDKTKACPAPFSYPPVVMTDTIGHVRKPTEYHSDIAELITSTLVPRR